MKLHRDTPGAHVVRAYARDEIVVGETAHHRSLVLTVHSVEASWPVRSVAELALPHVEALLRHDPEVLLLGTGERQRFPAPALLAPAFEAGVGVEVMDTRAACRTYNILAAEGRRVVAALMIEGGDEGAT